MFRLVFRQTEGLIGSIVSLLGLTLRVPDHTTLSRRAASLEGPRPQRQSGAHAEALHLLVDSTGLKLCGTDEWLVEKHGTRTRRAWRKLHIGVDAGTGQIMASALTMKAVPSGTADTAPTQRDGHLRCIAETGRMGWQTVAGYNRRAKVEAAIERWKQVIGDGLRSRRDERRATEVDVGVHVLNRMLALGRPSYVRVA